jgi:hypothetical protein
MAVLGASLVTIPDRVIEDRTWVVENGQRVLEIRPDPVVPGQMQMRDRKGNQVGTWKRDVLNPDRWILREGP